MASYVGHLTFSCALGAVYGGGATLLTGMDWGPACLGAGLTAVGGLMPDLDSPSSVPTRELFGLASVFAPLLLLHRVMAFGFTVEQTMAIMVGIYLFVRYLVSRLFSRITVHRGIFHSLPAMLIAGLIVFHAHENPDVRVRLYLACGTMLGFLSHLVLDELCSVDFSGARIQVNQFAGTALKVVSPSWLATITAYSILLVLAWPLVKEYTAPYDRSGGRQVKPSSMAVPRVEKAR